MLLFCSGALFAQALERIGGPYTVDSHGGTAPLRGKHNDAAATGKTDTALVPHTTNPSKIYFLNNTGVTGMGKCVRLDNGAITDSTYLTIADTRGARSDRQLDHRSVGEHLHVRRQLPGLSLGSARVHETRAT